MKRVVHLTTVHHLQDPRIFHKQCQSLSDAGYDVHLIVQHEQSETLRHVHVEALPMVGKSYRARLGLQRIAYQKALRLEGDVYHIHDPELIPLGYALKKRTGVCVIYDMHEDYLAHGGVEGRILRGLERWCFRWADHVVVANVMQQRIAMGDNVTVLSNHLKPYGPPPAIRTLPGEGEPLRLLYTGVIAGMRGLFDMIALAQAIKEQNLPWVIQLVGVVYIEQDREKADNLIQTHQLQDVIQRVGWDSFVNPEAMVPYYEHAHLGLALLHPQPSYMATIPTKFFEYTYYGLPIICSGFPGWKAFLKNHHCGAAVDNRQPETVISTIQHVIDSPKHYRTLALNGQTAVLERYLWKDSAEQLVQVYGALLN